MSASVATASADSPASSPVALASVKLTYRGHYCTGPEARIECEIYRLAGELAVHTLCPRCLNAQWIRSSRKSICFDAQTGALHIEPFECTWELGPERRRFGIGLCRCRVEYAGHEIRDA